MATDTASRASMDHLWNQHGSDGGRDRETRKRNTLEEAARQTAGPRAIAHYAGRTPSLVPADTHKNVDFVNDGDGGFKKMTDINDVVEYGEARVGRLTGVKPKDSNTTWITSVFHLPLSMCLEVPDYYPRVDDNGEIIRNEDGTKMNRSRWIVRPGMEDEANRYFEEVLKFWASILPGGIDAIHGGSINYDESRPHMHVISDPFEQNQRSKDPEALKMAFSKAFSYHPSSPKVAKTYPGTDKPELDDDGEPVMIGESAQMKMTRYHREFKKHLLDAGFDIEAERDAKRHNRRSDLHDYQTAQEQLAVAEAKTEHWENEVQPGLETQTIEDMKIGFELVEEPKLRQQVTKETKARVREEWVPKMQSRSKALDEREEAVKSAEADAAAEAEKIKAEAKVEAKAFADRARRVALANGKKILEKARKEAEEEAEKIKEQAEKIKTEADKIKADAKKTAKQEAEKIKTDAKTEAAGIKTNAQTEADKIKAGAEDNAKKIVSDAETEASEKIAEGASILEKANETAQLDLTAAAIKFAREAQGETRAVYVRTAKTVKVIDPETGEETTADRLISREVEAKIKFAGDGEVATLQNQYYKQSLTTRERHVAEMEEKARLKAIEEEKRKKQGGD